MATLITSFTNDEVKMRWREPYVTAGLNAKFALNTPGTYRGFRLTTNGAANTVTVVADSIFSDHVALYQTDTGQSLTIRRSPGNFNLDLTPIVDAAQQTWVIAIRADYTVGSSTTAVIRAYQLSPVDDYTVDGEVGELVVLGTVVMPAGGGVIPAANITHARRSYAWKSMGKDLQAWSPLVRNGSFEVTAPGNYQHATPFWRKTNSNDSTWQISTTARTGERSLSWVYGTVAGSGTCSQEIQVPVEAGRLLRYQFFKRAAQALTGGSVSLVISFLDADGNDASSTISVPLTGVDGSFSEVEGSVLVPAGMTLVNTISIVNTSATFGTPSSLAYRIDDIQVWIESDNQNTTSLFASRAGDTWATGLGIWKWGEGALGSDKGAFLQFDAPENNESEDDAGSVELLPLHPLASAGEPSPAIKQYAGTKAGMEYTLVRAVRPASGTGPWYREYVSTTGSFLKTHNAVWDNTSNLWGKDVNGQQATKAALSATAETFSWQQGATNSWADGAWTTDLLATSTTAMTYKRGLILGADIDTPATADSNIALIQDSPIVPVSNNVAERRLVWESGSDLQYKIRYYVCTETQTIPASFEYFEEAHNCYWDNVAKVWAADDTVSLTSYLHRRFRSTMQVKYKGITASTWADTAWDNSNEAVFFENYSTTGNSYLRFNRTTAPRIEEDNIPKAWGSVTVSTTITSSEVYECAVSLVGDAVHVVLDTAMTSTEYVVIPAVPAVGGNERLASAGITSTTAFDIGVAGHDGATVTAATGYTVKFVVFGRTN